MSYPGAAAPALEGVSFELEAGEALGLAGASGSGKSTLGLALAGLLPPGARVEARRLDFAGRSLLGLSERGWRELRGAQIGCVFQQPFLALSPYRRAGEQVADVLRAHGEGSAQAARAKARELLAGLGLGPALAEAFPHQLSGGQRQRVVFCQALAAGPRLLVADEPTASLDDATRDRLLELAARLRQEKGLALLWISHEVEVLEKLAARRLYLAEGKLAEEPPPPQPRRAAPPGPGARILAAAKALSVASGRGRFFERKKNRQILLDEAELELRQGEIVGLTGPSGSGKTTLVRCLAGLLLPTAGRLEIAGEDLAAASPERRRQLRRQIQMVGQDPASWVEPRWPLGKIVEESLRYGRAAKIPNAAERQEKAKAAMEELGLDPSLATRRPQEVSGGQLQRALLARALLCGAQALLLDEAFTALDPQRRAALLDLLLGLHQKHGLTLLIVSHQKSWLATICHRTLEMRPGGRLVGPEA